VLWAQAFYAISSFTVLRHLVSHVRSQTTSQGHSVSYGSIWLLSLCCLYGYYKLSCVCFC